MSKLVFIGEKFAGRVYEFAMEKTTVGRGDQNTLVLHDRSVSQAHCEILVNGPEVIVRDLGSANGTFVNDVRVERQRPMKSGQTVRFGLVEARLELDLPEWEDAAAEESAVFAARRWEQRLKHEEEMPKPSTDPVTLESDSYSASIDQTMMLPGRPQPAANKPPPQKDAPPPGISRGRLTIVVAAVVLAIAFSLWMLFGRR